MDARGSENLRPEGNAIMDSGHCLKCAASLKHLKKTSLSSAQESKEPVKVPVKPAETSYVMQIVSIGVRPDSVYEARMLLAPEVDMSSIKITVKGNNLRVNVCRPVNEQLVSQLPKITEKSVFGDMIKKMMKYCENLLIPEGIDGEKVRAVVDNKHKLLILTAPAMKPSKTRKKIVGKN